MHTTDTETQMKEVASTAVYTDAVLKKQLSKGKKCGTMSNWGDGRGTTLTSWSCLVSRKLPQYALIECSGQNV